MSKWTGLALIAFAAILGGSYYLLSQSKGKSSAIGINAESEMDVEDFDTEESDGMDKADNTYDMMNETDDDADDTDTMKDTVHPQDPADVETIDDEDDTGEMVQNPTVGDTATTTQQPKQQPTKKPAHEKPHQPNGQSPTPSPRK